MTQPPSPQSQLERFVAAVQASPHNLLSRGDRELLWERHIPECRSLSSRIPATNAPILDLGTGAGLPGLVIAVTRPDLQVELLEATGKKVVFLRQVIGDLGLDVTVHHGRAEDLGRTTLRGRYRVITARAVAPLDRLVGWAAPLLAPDGQLYAVKGDRWLAEVGEAEGQLRRRGLRVERSPDDDPTLRPRLVIIGRDQR